MARLVTEVDEGRHVAAASTRFGEVPRARARTCPGRRRPPFQADQTAFRAQFPEAEAVPLAEGLARTVDRFCSTA